jgi:hypothetical protein
VSILFLNTRFSLQECSFKLAFFNNFFKTNSAFSNFIQFICREHQRMIAFKIFELGRKVVDYLSISLLFDIFVENLSAIFIRFNVNLLFIMKIFDLIYVPIAFLRVFIIDVYHYQSVGFDFADLFICKKTSFILSRSDMKHTASCVSIGTEIIISKFMIRFCLFHLNKTKYNLITIRSNHKVI